MTYQKKRAARVAPETARETAFDTANNTERNLVAQVRRLRLAARCLDTPAVFVCDRPLTAELFDARGELADAWCW